MADRHRTGKQILLRLFRRLFAGAVLAVAAAYFVDFAVLQFKMARHQNTTGSVSVREVYEVPKKNKSTEFFLGDRQQESCVHALFPHGDLYPCWYLSRHQEEHVGL